MQRVLSRYTLIRNESLDEVASELLYYKVLAIRSLRQRLTDPARRSTDETILSIMSLALDTITPPEPDHTPFVPLLDHLQWLNVYGTTTIIETHYYEVVRIIKQRGGLDSLMRRASLMFAPSKNLHCTLCLTHTQRPKLTSPTTQLRHPVRNAPPTEAPSRPTHNVQHPLRRSLQLVRFQQRHHGERGRAVADIERLATPPADAGPRHGRRAHRRAVRHAPLLGRPARVLSGRHPQARHGAC